MNAAVEIDAAIVTCLQCAWRADDERRPVQLAAVEHDDVKGAVELAVATAAESVAGREAALAGSGATPASRAKAASELTRSWCDQVTIS